MRAGRQEHATHEPLISRAMLAEVSLAGPSLIICESGYTGPIGILNHTDHDAEARLRDNLEGLDWIVGELTGTPLAKPTPRTN